MCIPLPQFNTPYTVSHSYAIHGTNEPTSIGKPTSRGCLRLLQADIEYIYDALAPYSTPAEIRNLESGFTRWSTIIIKD